MIERIALLASRTASRHTASSIHHCRRGTPACGAPFALLRLHAPAKVYRTSGRRRRRQDGEYEQWGQGRDHVAVHIGPPLLTRTFCHTGKYHCDGQGVVLDDTADAGAHRQPLPRQGVRREPPSGKVEGGKGRYRSGERPGLTPFCTAAALRRASQSWLG